MPSVSLRTIAVAALAFLAGWMVRGWRAEAEISGINERNARATLAAEQQAGEREQVLADAIAMIDADGITARTKADAEIAALRARVDAGAVRLRIAARCPAPGLPATAAGPGLDTGSRAELDPDSRPDYFALRAGLTRQEDKLAACQAALKLERDKP